MRKFILIFVLLVSIFPISASKFNITPQTKDSLFNVLDEVIKQKNKYASQKLEHINHLKDQEALAESDEARFHYLGELFEEYKNFQMDSALVIADKRVDMANKIGSAELLFFSEMDFVNIMIVTGMYKEALDMLNKQDRSKFTNNEQYASLYHLYHSLYIAMTDYAFFQKEKEYYREQEYKYKDSILSILPVDNVGHKLVMISKLNIEKKYDESYQLAQQTYCENIKNYHLIGMLCHNIADIYVGQNNNEYAEYFLILSSINDLRSGIREYLSLPELAIRVYNDGNVDRAYKYMKCSLEDAILCQARLRTLQMSKTIPIINSAYDAKVKQEHQRLIIVIIITIISIIGLIISIIYIYKKLKELAVARKKLRIFNEELKQVNENLKVLNIELSESNYIKEEYIGYVFSICSLYLDKIDNLRKKINRKIKGGQIDELLKQTNSTSFMHDELKDFYKTFDSIFLNLYPNFISDFNSLLQDGKQIIPKDGELLTPEMRIYAIIRLGINDSIKIASFLHYSPQTIYNYRLKVRNKSKMPKEDLYKAIMSIGREDK